MFHYPSIFVLLVLVAVSLGDGNNPSDVDECYETENFCFLKPETGPCRAAISRWAFNATEGKCVQFIYGGCQGNTNNFESQEECLNNCSRSICSLQPETGSCAAAITRWAFNTEKGKCEPFSYGGCGGNKNNFESQEQCLNTCGTSICSLKPKTGPCKAKIPRWAFNATEGKCEQFTYGGCQGNENNFESKEKCLNTCGRSICSLQPEAGPCDAAIPRWAFNATKGKCEPFTYGGCGGNKNNFASQEKCLNTCGMSICSLQPETGPCEALIPRWAFNAEKGKCEQFTYGGCQGNKNNFKSQEQCLDTCGTSICLLQPETGPCKAQFPRWAFNAEKGKCISFTYGGCEGNKNSFGSQKECLSTCSRRICLLQPETGPCRAAIKRWAFNAEKGKCEIFSYGGCGGNKNNFKSEEECLNACGTRICSLEPDAGPCYGAFERWAFNEAGKCELFIYGGCGGNKNNFKSEEECLATCGPRCPCICEDK